MKTGESVRRLGKGVAGTGTLTGKMKFISGSHAEVQVITDGLSLEWWPGWQVFTLVPPKRWSIKGGSK